MSDLFAYPPRFMGRAEAARYMCVSITTFDELVADGTFPKAKKLKTKAVWDRVDLDLAATAVPEDGRTVTQTMLDHYRGKRQ
jgi:predicted DNA-binding transcriptional regulator AlpA